MSQAGPAALAAAAAAPSASLEHLRDLVETAIESNDVVPLVKGVFEVDAAEHAAGHSSRGGKGGVVGGGAALPAPPGRADGGESSVTRDSQGDVVLEGSLLERVLDLLGEVAEEKEAEITQMCRANAAEIAGSMHELGAMQRQTAELRRQLLTSNATLQAAGTAFAGRLEEVQQAAALQQSVAEARQAVGSALQVMQLIAKAARLIDGKQLYKAYKILEAIQQDHGALLQGGTPFNVRLPLPGAGTTVGAASEATAAGSREGTPHKAGGGGAGGSGGLGGRAGGGAAGRAIAVGARRRRASSAPHPSGPLASA